jgi:hypothetical protein
MLPYAVVRCEPGPNYRDEVCAPGRQGIRAKRDTNPARGSAHLLWDHAPRLFPGAGALSRFLALSRGTAACKVQGKISSLLVEAWLCLMTVKASKVNVPRL